MKPDKDPLLYNFKRGFLMLKFNWSRPIIILIISICVIAITSILLLLNGEYSSQLRWTPCNGSQMEQLETCPILPPNLIGLFEPDISSESLEAVEKRFEGVLQSGGYYKPKECIARDRVAIIVTSRDREYQMPVFLKNLHPVLMRQQLEYQIFIINQTPEFWFNKGALYNAGFIEVMRIKKWDCIILHDIDMVPMDDRNVYDCPRINPRHMAIDLDKFKFK